MVRQIDATARRRALAQAVLRIVTRDGLGAASVRTVAAESGLSAGSVRHFFSTQEELIVFAMEELTAAVGQRIAEAASIADPEDRVVAILAELVPLREDTRAEALAHLQFAVQARFTPALRPVTEESFAAIDGVCAQVVDWLADRGELAPGADRRALASQLRAVVDGLTTELLLAPDLLTPADAVAMLRRCLHTEDGR